MATTKPRWFNVTDRSRKWEEFYRDRWSYDKSVRTSHGVNCSGSCCWEVFVKNGLITWELQKTDWPQINSETPNYEPRGCQRGISSSWYGTARCGPKYPYVRGKLIDYYRAERARRQGSGRRPGRRSSSDPVTLARAYQAGARQGRLEPGDLGRSDRNHRGGQDLHDQEVRPRPSPASRRSRR